MTATTRPRRRAAQDSVHPFQLTAPDLGAIITALAGSIVLADAGVIVALDGDALGTTKTELIAFTQPEPMVRAYRSLRRQLIAHGVAFVPPPLPPRRPRSQERQDPAPASSRQQTEGKEHNQ